MDNQLLEYFRFKVFKGLKERHLDDKPAYKERLKYEIDVISKMGFVGYFLIVQDFVNWARSNNILVGPGRGSGVGSIACYCLNITQLDPIRYGLYFERFINPNRISLPDLDIDFPKQDREKVIQYCRNKYGASNIAHIGTFGFMQAKSAVRATTKILGYEYTLGDELAGLLLDPIQGKPQPISTSLEVVPELKTYMSKDCPQKEILTWASKMEGVIQNVGSHASGVVIANTALEGKVPLFLDAEKRVTTQFEMNNIEKSGYIKFDFLGLRTLDKISKTLKLIKKHHNKDIDVYNLPLDDKKVYRELSEGNTVGIFQLETSAGMRDLLIQIKPTRFEDIALLVAVYRPGPLASDAFKDYLQVRAKKARPQYLIPELEPILSGTDGLLVYQETMMRIAHELAGYTLGETDILRKACGKKIESLMNEQEEKFITGWVQNGYNETAGIQMWNQIKGFASYSFNAGHSTAYGLLSYITAWLKVNYPNEFMCANLIEDASNHDDVIKYVNECRRLGIKVLPPDINISNESFSLDENKNIRFGFGPIKKIGKATTEIITERNNGGKYQNFKDFCQRIDLSIVNKTKLETLIYAGAFDKIERARKSLLTFVEELCEYKKLHKAYVSKLDTYNKKYIAYKQRLIDVENGVVSEKGKKLRKLTKPKEPEKPIFPEVKLVTDDLTNQEIQMNERELLGFYVSSHPLDGFDPNKYTNKIYSIEKIKESNLKQQVSLVAIVGSVQEKTTRKKQPMAYVNFEDLTGTIDGMVFTKTYLQYKHLLVEGKTVLVDAIVDITERDENKIHKLKITELTELNMAAVLGNQKKTELPKVIKWTEIPMTFEQIFQLTKSKVKEKKETKCFINIKNNNGSIRMCLKNVNIKDVLNIINHNFVKEGIE